MNRWNIAGRVGQVRELNHTSSGDAVLGFSVAVDKRVKGEKQTLWVDCSIFGKRAEALQPYIAKGAPLAVSGEADMRVHEGKGYMQLRVSDVTLLGSSGERSEQRQVRQQAAPSGPPADDFDESGIPF